MLKLNASYSKKVPVDGQDYSSQSYHASVEIELPDGLAPEELSGRIHETFELVRTSVEQELHNGSVATPTPAGRAPEAGPAQKGKGNPGTRASAKQVRFLTDLAVRRGMDLNTLNAEVQRRFAAVDVSLLSRQQASQFIDLLSGDGNGRTQRRAA